MPTEPPTSRVNAWITLALAVLVLAAAIAIGSPRVGYLLLNTAWLAVAVCAISLPVGGLLALLLGRSRFVGKRLAVALLLGHLFLPLYLTAAAWDAGFGMQGWFSTGSPWLAGWRGAVWVHSMAAVPWVVLILGLGLRTLDAKQEEAASLDASALKVLRAVTFKHLMPYVFLAVAWVSLVCSSSMAVTDLFQVRTFAEEVYTQSALGWGEVVLNADTQAPPTAPSLVTSNLSLVAGTLLIALLSGVCLLLGKRCWQSPFESSVQAEWKIRSRWWQRFAAISTGAVLLFVVALPLGSLVYKAGVRQRSWSAEKTIERVLAVPREHRREIVQTAKIGVSAATSCVLIAIPLVWFGRKRSLGRKLLPMLLLAIVAVPGPVLGLVVIRLLNWPNDSPLSAITWCYDHTILAPWLLQTLRALPWTVAIVWPALASVPKETLESAAADGASGLRQLLQIALPMRLPALAAAWLVALLIAGSELAGTILVIPPGDTTLSVKLFNLLHYGVEDRVAAVCLFFIFFILIATWVIGLFMRMDFKTRS